MQKWSSEDGTEWSLTYAFFLPILEDSFFGVLPRSHKRIEVYQTLRLFPKKRYPINLSSMQA
jgi:hypothetical protein